MTLKKFNNLAPATLTLRTVAIVLTLPYLQIGIQEIISPNGIDATFGIPLKYPEGLKYLRVVGARNIVLSLLGIFFAIIGQRTSMTAMYVAMALMAPMDCFLVSTTGGIINEAIKHAVFVVLLLSMAIWIAFSGRSKK